VIIIHYFSVVCVLCILFAKTLATLIPLLYLTSLLFAFSNFHNFSVVFFSYFGLGRQRKVYLILFSFYLNCVVAFMARLCAEICL